MSATTSTPRDFPYIWATWLTKLLTGENSCEWAVWFKAHHRNWDKIPSDFNQTEWMLNHTALLNDQKSHWEARGDDVRVEAQKVFRLQGRTATLAGKPDIIVVRDSAPGRDCQLVPGHQGRGAGEGGRLFRQFG